MARSRRRVAFNCQVFAIAVVGLGGLFAVGCDECDGYGQTRCQGNLVQECIDDGDAFVHFYWTDRTSCPVACHAAGGRAHCVDSGEPASECAGVPNGEMCLDNIPSHCWDGYLSHGPACGQQTHCVVSAACGATCAMEDNPEPRCLPAQAATGPTTYFCDGSETLVSCACGYAADRVACSGSCRELGGESRCH
jgi:hypothetical protein